MFDVQVGVTVTRAAADVTAWPRCSSTRPRLMPGSGRATSRGGDMATLSPQCSGARYNHSASHISDPDDNTQLYSRYLKSCK